jgi:hypothetical protein
MTINNTAVKGCDGFPHLFTNCREEVFSETYIQYGEQNRTENTPDSADLSLDAGVLTSKSRALQSPNLWAFLESPRKAINQDLNIN